jgi:carbamoyl-phosphate synthase large subunit
VLVTGAGGPAAVGFLNLAQRADVDFYAADIDPVASGLYLVPADRRVMLPRGDAPGFATTVREVCHRLQIDVLVPTVDTELLPLAGVRLQLAAAGTALLAAPETTLVACLDKAELARVCAAGCEVPTTAVLIEGTPVPMPSIVKPRAGSGSRGVRLVNEPQDLIGVPRDGSYLVQEYLPGEELSVDVFVRADGVVVSAVPRTRDKVDSGVAVAGRTVADSECVEVATAVARAVGLRGIANVQLRRRADGRPALLEVNPRLPGSLVLTAAAGANLAALALAEVLGEAVPAHVPFREVAMVRFLAEQVVEIDEYARAGLVGASV